MPLMHYAFIVKGPGYSPHEHRTGLSSPHFTTDVVGVADCASAIQVAKQLILSGVQLIELCGGFTESEAQVIRVQTDNQVPIGVVTYSDQQSQAIDRLFI